MKNDLVRSRCSTVISELSVCQEIIIGRIISLTKVSKKDGSFLLFVRILSRGKVHRALVPMYSPLYLDIFNLQNKMVQAFIETITISENSRTRLLDIEAYNALTYNEFEKQCRF